MSIVKAAPGYNSWPMIGNIGSRLVCTYSCGTAHSIGEACRKVCAKYSDDGGKTWSEESPVVSTPDHGDVPIGKGPDENGDMLLWVRSCRETWYHELYRTHDGIAFERISRPALDPMPVQITDVFHVPGKGLMALWFAGTYQDDRASSWGTVVSTDNGLTWKQNVVESGLSRDDWPTEQSVIRLEDGTLFGIARTESGPAQFQLVSQDDGKTWKKERTNISDVKGSTPSLVYDPETGIVSNYYYERGKGYLKCRRTKLSGILGNPLAWPEPEIITCASPVTWDAGNVNSCVIGKDHHLAFYSGKAPDTQVLTLVSGPEKKISRGAFASSFYAQYRDYPSWELLPDEIVRRISMIGAQIGKLNAFDVFSDIPYDHALNNAVYYAMANGFLSPMPDGSFSEKEIFVLPEAAEEKVSFLLEKIWKEKRSRLAETAAVNAYKLALRLLASDSFPGEEKEALKKVLDAIRSANCAYGEKKLIAGDPSDPDRAVWKYENGPFVREYHIPSFKKDGGKAEIVFFSDTHYNFVNAKDEQEAHPSVMSTKIYRQWLKNGAAVQFVAGAVRDARFADQTIAGGDILDYLSWGCMQLAIENLFRMDTELLACPGGHDITRKMQGLVPDPSPLASRQEILRSFWPNDLHYASRIVRKKAMVIVMDNGTGTLEESLLYERLKRDLACARKEKLVVILACHEPLCTHNPAEKNLPPLRRNDPGEYNYAENLTGSRENRVYSLIKESADVVKAFLCGHMHSDYYTEILASYRDENGKTVPCVIPQIVSTGAVYDDGPGHLIRIVIE